MNAAERPLTRYARVNQITRTRPSLQIRAIVLLYLWITEGLEMDMRYEASSPSGKSGQRASNPPRTIHNRRGWVRQTFQSNRAAISRFTQPSARRNQYVIPYTTLQDC